MYLQGGSAIAAGLALYDLEQRNIQAGHAWALANAAGCASSGGTGLLGRLCRWLRPTPRNNEALRLAAYYPDTGAYVLNLRLHPREFIRWFEAAAGACRRLGDRRGEGQTLNNLGSAYAALGEPRRAIELYEQRLAIAREIGDRRGKGNVLFNSGLALDALGDREAATERVQAALAIYHQIEDPNADRVRAKLAEWEAGGSK